MRKMNDALEDVIEILSAMITNELVIPAYTNDNIIKATKITGLNGKPLIVCRTDNLGQLISIRLNETGSDFIYDWKRLAAGLLSLGCTKPTELLPKLMDVFVALELILAQKSEYVDFIEGILAKYADEYIAKEEPVEETEEDDNDDDDLDSISGNVSDMNNEDDDDDIFGEDN